MLPAESQWEDFWNSFPNRFGRIEFLRQVGKTFHGQPVSDKQFDLLVSDIVHKLDIQSSDRVLDLCCGNGLVTYAIAGRCQQVVGVDFSSPLIEIAREYHGAANISYHCMSVLDMNPENLHQTASFAKIYMYEALQHFQAQQLATLLERLLAVSNEKTVILLASIPHQKKLGRFYDTPDKQREYRKGKRNGALGLGTWWKQSTIRQVCSLYGFRCEFLPQPAELHTAHYRFDVRIIRE